MRTTAENAADARVVENPHQFSKLRVWREPDGWHVCRDRLNGPPPGQLLRPEHLVFYPATVEFSWRGHPQGGFTAGMPGFAFALWIARTSEEAA